MGYDEMAEKVEGVRDGCKGNRGDERLESGVIRDGGRRDDGRRMKATQRGGERMER